MKIPKILFFFFFNSLSVYNLYAIDHYISFNSGISVNNSKFEQHILKSSLYKVGPKGQNYYLAQEEYISKLWNFKGNSPTLNVEYLSHLTGINFGSDKLNFGIGLYTYNPKIKYSFKNSINNNDKDILIKLKEYNIQPYVIILIDIFNNNSCSLKLGTQLGINYLKMSNHYSNILINGKNVKQFTFLPQLVADYEMKYTKRLFFFTRVNMALINSIKHNVKYDNTLFTQKETDNKPVKPPLGSNAPPKPHKLVNTSVNNFIKYKNGSTYSFNFGIRYKI